MRAIRPGPGAGSLSFALTGLGGWVLFQADDASPAELNETSVAVTRQLR
jgi:hypothetical protein